MEKKILEKRILIEMHIEEDDCDEIYKKFVDKLGYEVLEENLEGKILIVELIKKY